MGGREGALLRGGTMQGYETLSCTVRCPPGLGKSLKVIELQLPHLQNEDDSNSPGEGPSIHSTKRLSSHSVPGTALGAWACRED